MSETKLLLEALKGKITPRVPFWFMRQAGRYLPEYRDVRATTTGFLDLCFTPEKAAEVTLQPLRRFGMDGAILFSDILVVPYGLGVTVDFLEGEGPRVALTNTQPSIEALDLSSIRKKLVPVTQTIRILRKRMADEGHALATLIGFAGAPWTVACYMLQGRSGKEFQDARIFALAKPQLMQRLIDTLVEATADYLSMQIEAGAEAIQIFDSWAGLLTPEEFETWVTKPTETLVKKIKKKHPETPIIGFAKGAMLNLSEYAKRTGVECIGVDQHTPMPFAIHARGYESQAVQGNLDPLRIAANKEGALRETEHILAAMQATPGIFNLGHGFIPQTPIENVAAVADFVKAWRR